MIDSMVPPQINNDESTSSIITSTVSSASDKITPLVVKPSNKPVKGPIWWSNAIFFIGMHVMAIVGATYLSPYSNLNIKTFW